MNTPGRRAGILSQYDSPTAPAAPRDQSSLGTSSSAEALSPTMAAALKLVREDGASIMRARGQLESKPEPDDTAVVYHDLKAVTLGQSYALAHSAGAPLSAQSSPGECSALASRVSRPLFSDTCLTHASDVSCAPFIAMHQVCFASAAGSVSEEQAAAGDADSEQSEVRSDALRHREAVQIRSNA